MDWKERVIEEKAQLDDRLKKLIEFQQPDAFKGLPVEHIKWLNRQRMVMELYSDILAERLALAYRQRMVMELYSDILAERLALA